MTTALWEHIDALAARDLAEQAKQDAEGTSAQLGQLVFELRVGAETAVQRIQGLEATLEASSKATEENTASGRCAFSCSSLPYFILSCLARVLS